VAGYLTLMQQQAAMSTRSQTWNLAISLAEAGVEEGLEMLNGGASNLAGDGWTQHGLVYTCTRTLASGSSYSVSLDCSDPSTPVMTSTGSVVTATIAYNPPRVFFAAATSYGLGQPAGSTTVSRVVRVTCTKGGLFTKALVAKNTINLNGNNITSDSFDSSNPAYSTGGQYDSTKRRANGDIATNDGIANAISVGNANIYGHVATGPSGTVTIGPDGVIGDLAWHASNTGIEPGGSPPWVTHDSNFCFPDTALPPTSGCVPPAAGSIVTSALTSTTTSRLPATGSYVGGITTNTAVTGHGSNQTTSYNYTYNVTTNTTNAYTALLNGSTSYLMNSLAGSILVNGPGVRIIAPNGFSMSGSDTFTIAPGASVTVYAGGTSCSIGGNGVINQPGYAASFILYCAPSVTSFSFSGNGGFTGILIAPNVNISMNGGGNNITDFIGSLVVNSVTMNGHFNFHYDESLGSLSNGRMLISSWNEITH